MKMFVVLGSIASIVITAILRGFVFQSYWTWFILPLFNVPTITIAESLGLMLVVGMVTSTNSATEEKKESFTETLVKSTIKSLLMSVIYLVFGYIVKIFI